MQGPLLQRIMNAERPGRQPRDALTEQIDSIGSYLGRLLNTRQGSASIAPDLGLPDITNFTRLHGGEDVHAIEALIEGVISRYEPRLQDVQVRHEPSAGTAFTLAFSLSAKMDNEGTLLPVLFETILLPDGRIDIKGYA